MGFFKKDNIYRITRITGSQDNILGVGFDDKNRSDNKIEVIEWDFPNMNKSIIRTSKEEVLEQVTVFELDILHSYGKIPKISSLSNKPLVIEN